MMGRAEHGGPHVDVAEIVRHFAEHRPGGLALRAGTRSWTWRELDDRSSRVALLLREEGIGPGDPVAHLDRNGPEHLEVLYGAAKLGAVFTPLNFRLSAGELADIVADSGARLLLVGEELAPVAADVVDRIGHAVTTVVIGGPGEDAYEPRLARQHPEVDVPAHERRGDEVLLLLYTSGTTGPSKGVELTDDNVEACISMFDEVLGIGAPDAVCLAPLPLFHVGGLMWAMTAQRFGTPVVLVRDLVPAEAVELIERERVTHAGLVPAVMQALLDVPTIGEADLSSLRAVLYGAAPITEALLRKLLPVLGCAFHQAYGLTETTATVALLGADDHDPDGPRTHLLRSCGRPVPGVEFRVVDLATGEEAGVDEPGELWIRGPNVMQGYHGRPEATAEAVVDGWFRSGDVGRRDADGYLFLHDRTRDMIISGGENLSPTEIEQVLATHPAVAECAVVGVPSDRWGETPKAFVVASADTSEPELLGHCRQGLAHYKCPTSVELVDALPRNASGKVLRRELRQPYWEGAGRSI